MSANRLGFPDIVVDDGHAHPHFARAVQTAVRQFDFSELPEYQQTAFRVVRDHGAVEALNFLRTAMASVRAESLKLSPEADLVARHGDDFWFLTPGEKLLGKMSVADRARFFPFHDFRVLPYERNLVVQCFSLSKTTTSLNNPAYYSWLRPTIELEGKAYVVAWTREAILQTMWRLLNQGHEDVLKPERISDTIESRLVAGDAYAALGDVNGFFELCRHFEVCKIWGNANNADTLVPAVTFFDECRRPFWSHQYVKELGGADYDSANGTPYYRVGYCPVVLDGDFAILTTFLPPGFKKTLEYQTIERLPRLKDLATTPDKAPVWLTRHRDFSALRHFHNHGYRQLIQTHEEWFAGYPEPRLPPPL
jgi:hypothetical protein